MTAPALSLVPEGPEILRFEAVDPDECWALLRGRTIGRIAWSGPDGPELLPVSYAVDDDTVLVRTQPRGRLSTLHTGQQVVFEIDDLDEATRTGWSVRADGRVVVGVGPASDRPEAGGPSRPWRPGPCPVLLTLHISRLTGRVISA